MSERLIGANTLKEYLTDLVCEGGNENYQKGVNNALHKLFPQIIDDIPTIDPETLPIVQELREKLSHYEKAEQEGRLIELPLKIGDTVWIIAYGKDEIVKCKVRTMKFMDDGKIIFSCNGRMKNGHMYCGNFLFKSIGKLVFFTEEEAEAALKEREA